MYIVPVFNLPRHDRWAPFRHSKEHSIASCMSSFIYTTSGTPFLRDRVVTQYMFCHRGATFPVFRAHYSMITIKHDGLYSFEFPVCVCVLGGQVVRWFVMFNILWNMNSMGWKVFSTMPNLIVLWFSMVYGYIMGSACGIHYNIMGLWGLSPNYSIIPHNRYEYPP